MSKISVSTRWWQTDDEGMRKWQYPDILIQESFLNYQSNLDPVLEAVLDYK
ncbi:MAG: hypothetical protein GY936_10870 [Ignavibacteriae bacterium]|nr:hypothetical protein [Ignavibacteriota bacterium]